MLPVSAVGYIPSWLRGPSINLGLDLRGGSYLLLEVDTGTYFNEQMSFLEDSVRQNLRKSHIGYKNLKHNASSVTLDILRTDDIDAVKKGLLDVNSQLTLDVNNGTVVASLSPAQQTQIAKQVIGQSIEIIRRRIDETGTKEPDIQQQGENRILLQMPGVENPEQIKSILGKTAKLTFHMVDAHVSPSDIAQGRIPLDTQVLPLEDSHRENHKLAIKRQSLLSGDMLTNASSTYSQGQAVVSFTFNQAGAQKFAEVTRENIGKAFAVVLDDKIITAPVIQSAILGGSGIITGNFTIESAEELALLLRAGALPAPLHIVEERTVGPSLGNDSIAAGKFSAIVGVCFIIVFISCLYGLFGIIASIALLVNLILLMAGLSVLQATLTLPGIAGIALSLGMTVDANVLIFERIKEEIRKGSSVIASIDRGFKHAFGTIIDAHLTALLAAFLLFTLGNGPIKGFGVTLSIGLICSLFTAITFTRLLIYVWLKLAKPKHLTC
ncbi:MAG: protein translocase subunit SecD [Alphaproteobacteria bacterium]|nr:protein translocase subunit SecD [Alphaproteobacteria bacterium]